MRGLAVSIVPLLLLSACDSEPGAIAGKSPGRYAGIGTFDAGRLWGLMKDVPKPADPDAATIADDEQIVVVIDSYTGEVRQCGNHSGYCVTMNPWSGGADPVKLELHANQLDAETVVEEAPAEPVAAPR
jgi:hypothetical protein